MGLGARLHGLLKDEASIATFTQYICLSPGTPLMREQGSSLHGHQAEKILHATKHIQVIRVSFDAHYPPPTVVVVSPFPHNEMSKKSKACSTSLLCVVSSFSSGLQTLANRMRYSKHPVGRIIQGQLRRVGERSKTNTLPPKVERSVYIL